MSRGTILKLLLATVVILAEILVQASAFAWVISPLVIFSFLFWHRYLEQEEFTAWGLVFCLGFLLQAITLTNAGVLPLALVLTYLLRYLLLKFLKSGLVMNVLLSLGFLNFFHLVLILIGYRPSAYQVATNIFASEIVILLVMLLISRIGTRTRAYV